MDLEYIPIQTVVNIKATGKMIFSMVLVNNSGRMGAIIKAILKWGRNMEMANIFGNKEIHMMGNGLIIKFQDMGLINGRIKESIQEIGCKI